MKKFALLVAVIIATSTLTMACKSQREGRKTIAENNEKRVIKELSPYRWDF